MVGGILWNHTLAEVYMYLRDHNRQKRKMVQKKYMTAKNSFPLESKNCFEFSSNKLWHNLLFPHHAPILMCSRIFHTTGAIKHTILRGSTQLPVKKKTILNQFLAKGIYLTIIKSSFGSTRNDSLNSPSTGTGASTRLTTYIL